MKKLLAPKWTKETWLGMEASEIVSFLKIFCWNCCSNSDDDIVVHVNLQVKKAELLNWPMVTCWSRMYRSETRVSIHAKQAITWAMLLVQGVCLLSVSIHHRCSLLHKYFKKIFVNVLRISLIILSMKCNHKILWLESWKVYW